MLQQLPWNVQAQVVRQLHGAPGGRRSGHGGSSNIVGEEKRSNRLAALLGTCRALRVLALERLCREMTIAVSCTPEMVYAAHLGWPTNVGLPGSEHDHLVRAATVDVDFWSILNGRAARLLEAWGRVLAGARVLTLNFEHFELGYDDDVRGAALNVNRFARCARALFPALRDVRVRHCAGYAIMRPEFHDALTRHLPAALALPCVSAAAVTDDDSVAPALPAAPQLTSIVFTWNMYFRHAVQLVHNSTQTLRTLTIAFNHVDGLALLVEDTRGRPVTYPALRELHLSCWYYLEQHPRPSTAGVVFPQLRQLHIDMDYPFADDTLFRGNSGALEVLRMNVDSDAIAMAQRHRVFGEGRFAALRSVRVRNINNSQLKPGAPSEAATRFALEIGARAQTLTIEDITMDRRALAPLVKAQAPLDHLQLLVVPDAALTLAQIARLLARAPRLAELHCMFSGLGVSHTNSDRDIVHFAVAAAAAAHTVRFFSVLRTGYCAATSVGAIARCAAALAIICPRFARVDVPSHLVDALNAAMAQLVIYGQFAPHAARLQQVVF
ncbi:hypothetical protein H4R18_001659 [Coemansia javaensis]|uniref:Uncharacterized protein n=1 Tax=Coemansia javaensis TaxID=2761396 RepID=A0A9W8HF17_9FUNG|nr:hypothetical protein H4R18_001659 [Coemansia javaensis]